MTEDPQTKEKNREETNLKDEQERKPIERSLMENNRKN